MRLPGSSEIPGELTGTRVPQIAGNSCVFSAGMPWRNPGPGVPRGAYTVRLRSKVAGRNVFGQKATNSFLHLRNPVRSTAGSKTQAGQF